MVMVTVTYYILPVVLRNYVYALKFVLGIGPIHHTIGTKFRFAYEISLYKAYIGMLNSQT